jgi:hypothetical protein
MSKSIIPSNAVAAADETVKMHRALSRRAAATRKNLVQTYMLQGKSPKDMAKLLGVSEQEVVDDVGELVEEMKNQFDLLPEGPMIIAQLASDGYARLYLETKAMADDCYRRFSTSNDSKAWLAVVQAYRIVREVMDSHTAAMERWGLLPSYGKGGKKMLASEDSSLSKREHELRKEAKAHGIDVDAIDVDITSGIRSAKPAEFEE